VVSEISSIVLTISTSESNGTSVRNTLVIKVETETIVINLFLVIGINEPWLSSVKGDSGPGESTDTVEFREQERESAQVGGFSDFVV